MEHLNIPNNALSELKAYLNSAPDIANALLIENDSVTYSAYKGFCMLNEKQKAQLKEISYTLSYADRYDGISKGTAEKIVVKTLENITKSENKQGYLNLVQFITHPYTFNIGIIKDGKDQFDIAKHLIENSSALEYSSLKIFESYENRKKNLESIALDLRLHELKQKHGKNAERILKKEIEEYDASMESIVTGFLAVMKSIK